MDDDDIEIEHEERAIYIITALAGLPVVIAVLLDRGILDAGSTISLACVVLAVLGLTLQRRGPRLPRATLRARAGDSRRPPR
jgi:hypothetical protein